MTQNPGNLYIMAINGKISITDNANIVGLEPSKVEEICRQLQKAAAEAKTQIAAMTDCLRSAGWVWVVLNPDTHFGCWMFGRTQINGHYDHATRQAYAQLPVMVN